MVRLVGKVLWRWKSTSIDFSLFESEWDDTCHKESKRVKMSRICRQLSLPFNKDVHEWENGQFSCEYNEALRHAFELDLVEQVYYIEELDSYVDSETYYAWNNFIEDIYQQSLIDKDKALELIKKVREKTDDK